MLSLRFPIRQVVVCVACNCIYEIKKQPAKVSVQEAPSKMPNFLKKKSDGGLIHDGVHSVAAGSVRMVARPVRLMLFSGVSPDGRSQIPCVWIYRDRSFEKYWHFLAKLSKSGPDKSKRIVRVPGR
jgi:hypothetical protein